MRLIDKIICWAAVPACYILFFFVTVKMLIIAFLKKPIKYTDETENQIINQDFNADRNNTGR